MNITCLADAIPNATILWFVGDMRVPESDQRYRVFQSEDGSSSSLQISAIDSSVYREYKCQAINQLGESEVLITLREGFVPGVAEGIDVIKKSPQSVTFKFRPMSKDGGLPITAYHVSFVRMNEPGYEGASQTKVWNLTKGSSSDILHLDGLQSEAEYQFKFAAANSAGVGEFGNMLFVRLPKVSQPEPVVLHRDFDANRVTEDEAILSPYNKEFKVRWHEPNDNGMRIESYDVKYYKVSET